MEQDNRNNNSKIGRIYIIKNIVNNKVYIGQTTMTLHERFLNHMKPSTQESKQNYKFYRAIKEIGKQNFYIELLEDNIPKENLDEKEIYYIKQYDSYKNGYNSTNGGKAREICEPSDIINIIKMYENGASTKEIADIYHVCPYTILRTVHDFEYYPQTYPAIEENDLRDYLNQGLSNSEIAQIYNCSPDTIKRHLAKHKLRRKKPYLNQRKDFNWQEFFEDIKSEIPEDEICDKYDITKRTYQKYRKQLI